MRVLKKININVVLSLLMVFVVGSLSAQSKIGVSAPPFKTPVFVSPTYTFLKVPDLELDKAPVHLRTPYFSPHWEAKPFNSELATDVLNILSLFNNFNQSNMPFFCRIEYQNEQAARFPVKFRLGEINYVDRLEQKRDWELGN